jgi:hypothetical protein
VNDTLNANYSFATVSFQFTPVAEERIDFVASLCRPGFATAAEEPGACHLAGTYWLGRTESTETAGNSYCYNLKWAADGWSWGRSTICGLKWTSGVGWTEHLNNILKIDTTTTPGVVSINEPGGGGWVNGFPDPYYVAPVLPAFGGPNLVSAIPDATVFPGGSKSFNVASHFNATKSPGSAFKYFVTTNNHALLEVRNASQDLGTFELKSLSTSGNATVTVKVVAVERDVDVWVATSTFAVSVGNIAPTIKLALPDVTGTKTLSLSKYFKDDHGQLTYSLTVEDPNVVNATLVGSTLYVQSGLFRDGRSLVTVTASDGFANVSSAINASYVFSVSLQYSSLNTFEFILAATNTKLVSFQRSGCLRRERRHCLVRWVEKRPNGSNRDDGRGWSVQPDRPIE